MFWYIAKYSKGWLALGIVKMFLFPCLKIQIECTKLMLAIYIEVTPNSNSIKEKTQMLGV